MIINVTRNCIKKGVARNSRACPIALALIKAGFNDVQVIADEKEVRIYGVYKFKYELDVIAPKKVFDFVTKFDKDEEVKPFTFSVRTKK